QTVRAPRSTCAPRNDTALLMRLRPPALHPPYDVVRTVRAVGSAPAPSSRGLRERLVERVGLAGLPVLESGVRGRQGLGHRHDGDARRAGLVAGSLHIAGCV